ARQILEGRWESLADTLPPIMVFEELLSLLSELQEQIDEAEGKEINGLKNASAKIRSIINEGNARHFKRAAQLSTVEEARRILQGASDNLDAALDQLARVSDMLGRDYPDISFGFDFCELRGYNYHTGLVFAAYVPGHGDAVGKGGRYDAIGRDFGRARPATGFSLDVRALVALGRRPTRRRLAIWAPADPDPALDSAIAGLRMTETVVRALPEDVSVSPAERGCDRIMVKRDGQWVVEQLEAL
ncbi:MAG: ATP phosphoribosyltransferase regulatory subunit, partial [Marinobacter sp.]